MKIIEKIIKLNANDDTLESIISKFLIADLNNIKIWTHKYIVENTHCSKATLSRYINKIGFKNFNEFYYSLLTENEKFIQKKHDLDNEIEFSTIKNIKLISEWLNSNNIFLDLRELLITKRRIFIVSDVLSTGMITTSILDFVFKRSNVQILNISNMDETMLNHFDQNDVFINIILRESEKYFSLLKELFNKRIMSINISNQPNLAYENNKIFYNLALPCFKKNKQISEIISIILLLSTLNDYI
ncbi:hypothetical protein [Spiroplasma clarkii]|uniref:HTH rpiR-type domain-containing protein n=1 Tax=Spiroplasma clarkii TaxID=2139 RepID=A0A2K8KGG2_9MOLU|nr:hypothetical protein [Spiroplasma clarkii]ATX70768.1 hypothetical protein SCLAR_v1c04440 [Spiroplasma clarkii]